MEVLHLLILLIVLSIRLSLSGFFRTEVEERGLTSNSLYNQGWPWNSNPLPPRCWDYRHTWFNAVLGMEPKTLYNLNKCPSPKPPLLESSFICPVHGFPQKSKPLTLQGHQTWNSTACAPRKNQHPARPLPSTAHTVENGSQGCGDGSVSKVLAIQVGEPKFNLPKPT